MLEWLLSGKKLNYTVDVHSHLIPGVDDGVKSMEETLQLLREFELMGVRKVITTPHIYHEFYPNTEEDLKNIYSELLPKIKEQKIDIEFEMAAEYFCDQYFLDKINSNKALLKFGDNFVLLETSFYSKPAMFEEVVFSLLNKGYTPVLAHPERYQYLEESIEWLELIIGTGVLLQVNWGSLAGAYGKVPKKIAQKLLKKDMVTFMGSDLHRQNQLELLKKAMKTNISSERIKNAQLS